MTTMSPAFRRVLSSAEKGERMIPALRSYLYKPNFPSFEVPIGAFTERPPDGWFHPSTHPLWPERMLYFYIARPNDLIREPMDPLGTMSVTAGNFWHYFIQCCLTDMGMLEAVEHPVQDDETGSRGSMDGVLAAAGPWPKEGWEFKTMHPAKLNKIKTLDDFKENCPVYYAQAQEYLRMSGLPVMRVLILALILPYTMVEIVVPYDPGAALGVRDKYLRVRQAVADQRMPEPCCAPRSTESKACPARHVCPIGLIR